jgi:hypothetical protein
LQITENKTAGAEAQHDFVALPARLKSCPDTFCSLNGIMQEAQLITDFQAPSCYRAAQSLQIPLQ